MSVTFQNANGVQTLSIAQARSVLQKSRRKSELVQTNLKAIVSSRLNDLVSFSDTVLSFDHSLSQVSQNAEKILQILHAELMPAKKTEEKVDLVHSLADRWYCLSLLETGFELDTLQHLAQGFNSTQTNSSQMDYDIKSNEINSLLSRLDPDREKVEFNQPTIKEIKADIILEQVFKEELNLTLLKSIKNLDRLLTSSELTLVSTLIADKSQIISIQENILVQLFSTDLVGKNLLHFAQTMSACFPQHIKSILTSLKNKLYTPIDSILSKFTHTSKLAQLESRLRTQLPEDDLFLFDLFFEDQIENQKQNILASQLRQGVATFLQDFSLSDLDKVIQTCAKLDKQVFTDIFTQFLTSLVGEAVEASEDRGLIWLCEIEQELVLLHFPETQYFVELIQKSVGEKVEAKQEQFVQDMRQRFYEGVVEVYLDRSSSVMTEVFELVDADKTMEFVLPVEMNPTVFSVLEQLHTLPSRLQIPAMRLFQSQVGKLYSAVLPEGVDPVQVFFDLQVISLFLSKYDTDIEELCEEVVNKWIDPIHLALISDRLDIAVSSFVYSMSALLGLVPPMTVSDTSERPLFLPLAPRLDLLPLPSTTSTPSNPTPESKAGLENLLGDPWKLFRK